MADPSTLHPQKDSAAEVQDILGSLGVTSAQMAVRTNSPLAAPTPDPASSTPEPAPITDLQGDDDLALAADAMLKQAGADLGSMAAAAPEPESIEALDQHLAEAVDSLLEHERRDNPLSSPEAAALNAPPPPSPQPPVAAAPPVPLPTFMQDPAEPVARPTESSAPKPAETQAKVLPPVAVAPVTPAPAAPPPAPKPVPASASKPAAAPSRSRDPLSDIKVPTADTGDKAAKGAGFAQAVAKQGKILIGSIEPPALQAAATISKPLASKSKFVRDLVGAAALVTLFWAGCFWAYALILQPPVGPSTPKPPEEKATEGHGETKDDGHGAGKDDGHGEKKTAKASKKNEKKPEKKADAKKKSGGDSNGGGH
jgi:hypothetical protein